MKFFYQGRRTHWTGRNNESLLSFLLPKVTHYYVHGGIKLDSREDNCMNM